MILTLNDWLNNCDCFSMALAVDIIDRLSNKVCYQLQPKKSYVGKAILAIYIAAKDVLAVLHY